MSSASSSEPDLLPVGTERAGVDGDAREPAVRRAVGRGGHEFDARRVAEKLAVAGVDSLPRRHALRQNRELRAADSGQEVAEAVVEADLGVLVVRYRLAGLRGELPRMREELVVAPGECPATARRDDLVAVEGQSGERRLRARALPAVGGTERLGGVLDQDDVVPRAHVDERVVVAAPPVEIDRNHRSHAATGALARLDRLVQQARVDQPAVVAVDEERLRPAVDDRVGARGERQRGARDLVSGPDPVDDERQVEGSGAAREGQDAARTGCRGELRLECVDVRAERGDPVRLDGVTQQVELGAGEVRWGEKEAGHGCSQLRRTE